MLKDTWQDKSNNKDIIDAEDINSIAQAVIEGEENPDIIIGENGNWLLKQEGEYVDSGISASSGKPIYILEPVPPEPADESQTVSETQINNIEVLKSILGKSRDEYDILLKVGTMYIHNVSVIYAAYSVECLFFNPEYATGFPIYTFSWNSRTNKYNETLRSFVDDDTFDEYSEYPASSRLIATYVHDYVSENSGNVTPEQIQEAVEQYLAENPITVTETDPTVPAWAKAATKPTYTAAEVGALPDTTVIPSVVGLATETYVQTEIAKYLTINSEVLV